MLPYIRLCEQTNRRLDVRFSRSGSGSSWAWGSSSEHEAGREADWKTCSCAERYRGSVLCVNIAISMV